MSIIKSNGIRSGIARAVIWEGKDQAFYVGVSQG